MVVSIVVTMLYHWRKDSVGYVFPTRLPEAPGSAPHGAPHSGYERTLRIDFHLLGHFKRKFRHS